ncbi:hypothetical protein P152DRAFT_324387, partial [Eremomyces bilateralis CBS 781.70]
MVGGRMRGKGPQAKDASPTRPQQADHPRPNTRNGVGEQNGRMDEGRMLQIMENHIKLALESCRGWAGAGSLRGVLEAHLTPVLRLIPELAQRKSMEKAQAGTPARDPAMGQILERLGRIEAGIAKDRGRPAAAPTTETRTWSEIAAGGKTKAVVEVRLSEMAGAVEETTEEKLQRIKKVIPDAKAIIPHHRAAGKVSVVVPTTTRRDQIIATGIAGDDGIKLIRRPKLLMVMGIPIHTQITTGESEGNTEWARQMSNQNAVKIERIS